jgi:hypothetical protein
MAYQSKTMSQIKQLFTLQDQGYGFKPIARITGISRNTIKQYFNKASSLGLSYSELISMNDFELESLFDAPEFKQLSSCAKQFNSLNERRVIKVISYCSLYIVQSKIE